MTKFDEPIDTPPRAPSPLHRFATLAVHAGSPHDPATGAVIEAVSLARRPESDVAVDFSSRFLCRPRSPRRAWAIQWAHMNTAGAPIPIGQPLRQRSDERTSD